MAKELGTFPSYEPNAQHMLRVIRNHRRAAHGERQGYEGLAVNPVALIAEDCRIRTSSPMPVRPGTRRWSLAKSTATAMRRPPSSHRPARLASVMDCDTTGIEPDFALVKFKKLAGGGYFKIINRAVPEALRTLGYSESQIAEIEAYAVGHGNLNQAPGVNPSSLKSKGFTDEKIEALNAALKSAFDIKFAFNKWTLGEDFCKDVLKLTG